MVIDIPVDAELRISHKWDQNHLPAYYTLHDLSGRQLE